MRKKFLSGALGFVLMALVMAGSASAAPAYESFVSTMTLDQLIRGTLPFKIDDKLFYNFGYGFTSSQDAHVITASGINVTPITTPFDPGLAFTAGWGANNGSWMNSIITYTVQVMPGGNAIKDLSLGISGGAIGTGSVVVNEFATIGNALYALNTFINSTGAKLNDSVTFAPTMLPINVIKDIKVTSDRGQMFSIAGVSLVTQQYSEVPIPGGFLLLGPGLAGLVLFRRRLGF